MPTLKWIGKDKVINYHNEVPFRLLNEKREYSVNSNETENLLIKGDNLEALKALLPYYYNRIKVIYIDPPYNTGNENWRYNDNVSSPQIKKWLGKVVGGEAEDLSRHDKWLCMMMPRLKLLRELLGEDGIIFASIDENEVHHLRILMDSIFGENNFIAQLGWQKVYSTKNQSTFFSNDYEFVLCYSKSIEKAGINLLPRTEEMNKRYINPDNDPRGPWKAGDLISSEERTGGHYIIRSPITGKEFDAPEGKHWSFSKENMMKCLEDNRLWFGKDGNSIPSLKQFLSEVQQGRKASTLLFYKEFGHTDEAKKEIITIFSESEHAVFDTPKPVRLIKNLIILGANQDSIILDSFAGSGTTAHAVLDLNREDSGNRRFILVECEDSIAKDITAERLKRVIQGYSYEKSSGQEIKVEGLGGGFKFLELGNPLFDKHKQIIGQPSYEDLAGYIYFTETHSTIDWGKASRGDWYVGENGGVHYFIIYGGKNELGEEFLQIAKCYQGKKVVYADAVMIDDDELERFDIIFKQIPYEIKTF